jgi:hypothetical protein
VDNEGMGKKSSKGKHPSPLLSSPLLSFITHLTHNRLRLLTRPPHHQFAASTTKPDPSAKAVLKSPPPAPLTQIAKATPIAETTWPAMPMHEDAGRRARIRLTSLPMQQPQRDVVPIITILRRSSADGGSPVRMRMRRCPSRRRVSRGVPE